MAGQRPFYFFVVVWGESYVDRLLNFCIPTLLAPGNVPALERSRKSRLLVISPTEDWQRMQRSPVLGALRAHLEPVHIELPPAGPDVSVYDHMSLGHRLATEAAYRDRAYGVMLTPDMMISDGSIAAIQRHAEAGVQVVLTAALRYGEEPMFEHLEKLGGPSADSRAGEEGRALVISGRQMAYAGVNGFHHETLRFEWDAPYFAPFYTGLPGVAWWRVPGEDGVLLHSSSWVPILVDYASLPSHDSSTMEHWAIDGDYVYRNFGLDSRIHVVQDSDEVMLVSWTPMSVLQLSRKPKRLQTYARLGQFVKGALLRDAFLGPYSDPLKRKVFFLPVRMHARELGPAWTATERRAEAILDRYLKGGQGILQFLGMRMIGVVNRVFVVLRGRWANRGRILEMSGRALRGDADALDYLRRRTRLYLRQLIGRSAGGE